MTEEQVADLLALVERFVVALESHNVIAAAEVDRRAKKGK